jgi:ADP-ribose pyrophosphatase YjhB (NUDIX family)
MHVDETVLEPIRRRYGEPAGLQWEGELAQAEFGLVHASGRSGRRHDVTVFIFSGDRLALIRKPHFAEGIWRPPSGGVKPGEDFVAGTVREALEETGVDVELERYLVRTEAVFRHGEDSIPWSTHVFAARTDADVLAPIDRVEIAAARWGSAAELAGPLRAALLGTGRALWRYRVALHDAALAALGSRRPG